MMFSTGFSDDKATVTQYRLVLGLDNGERGDKGVELEDWLLSIYFQGHLLLNIFRFGFIYSEY